MKSAGFFAIALLLAAGCQSIPPLPGTSDSGKSNWVTEHIRVDDAVIDNADAFSVIEPVYWTVTIYHGEAEYEKSLAGFSREQRLVLAVIWYLMEVANGGHDQFYYNSTGIVWKDALAGFREMGVDEAAAIIEESAKRMGGDPSLDRETRWKQLDALDPEFDDLDEKLYSLDDTLDLYAVMHDYIVKHRTAFYYEGDVKKPQVLSR